MVHKIKRISMLQCASVVMLVVRALLFASIVASHALRPQEIGWRLSRGWNNADPKGRNPNFHGGTPGIPHFWREHQPSTRRGVCFPPPNKKKTEDGGRTSNQREKDTDYNLASSQEQVPEPLAPPVTRRRQKSGSTFCRGSVLTKSGKLETKSGKEGY